MADGKYGRLFTERDVERIVAEALIRQHTQPIVTKLAAVLEHLEPGELTFPADEPLFLLRGKEAMLAWQAANPHRVGSPQHEAAGKVSVVLADSGGPAEDGTVIARLPGLRCENCQRVAYDCGGGRACYSGVGGPSQRCGTMRPVWLLATVEGEALRDGATIVGLRAEVAALRVEQDCLRQFVVNRYGQVPLEDFDAARWADKTMGGP